MKTESEYARLFAAAVAEVVDNARWDARISSVRELGREAGLTHSVLSDRFTKGVPFTVRDLAQVAPVLGLTVHEIIERAEALLEHPAATDVSPAVLARDAEVAAEQTQQRDGRHGETA